jgi:hypothetical protein
MITRCIHIDYKVKFLHKGPHVVRVFWKILDECEIPLRNPTKQSHTYMFYN